MENGWIYLDYNITIPNLLPVKYFREKTNVTYQRLFRLLHESREIDY